MNKNKTEHLNCLIFFLFLLKTKIVWAVLTSTHNVCFGAKIRKIGIRLHTTVLLYKHGVHGGIYYMEKFRKILTRYRRIGRIGYNLNVMRQSACLLFSPIMVDNYAAFFNCISLYDGLDIKLFILVVLNLRFFSVAWPTGIQLLFFIYSGFQSYSASSDLHRRY